jgi:hypothetical protein
MIEYSGAAKIAVATFMRPYNDVDIYVEDQTYKGLYERIINRSIEGRGRVSSVIPIGCRADVERAAANDNGSDGRRKIYIVDGDLDLLARGRHEKVPNLHRLSVYAVENLVLSSESVSSYADIVCPHLTSAEASSRVGVDDVLKNVRTYGAGYLPFWQLLEDLS